MSEKADRETEFRHELSSLINRYGLDNAMDTPDYILASFIMDTITSLAWINNEILAHQGVDDTRKFKRWRVNEQ